MKKSRQWLFLAATAVVVVGLAVHTVLSEWTASGRDDSVATLYAKLADKAATPAVVSLESSESVSSMLPADTPPGLDERWDRAFTRVSDLFDPDKNPEWRATWQLLWKLNGQLPDSAGVTEEDWREAGESIESNADLVAELIALSAFGMPTEGFDAAPDDGRDVQSIASHCAAIEGCTCLLNLDTLLKAHEGHHEEAVESFLAGTRFGVTLPWLDGTTFALITEDNAFQSIFDGEALENKTSEELLAGLAAWSSHDAFPVRHKRRVEFDLQLFAEFSRFSENAHQPVQATCKWLYSTVGRPLMNADVETYADMAGQLADLAGKPYYEVRPALEQFEKDRQETNLPLARIGLGFEMEEFADQARVEAAAGLAQVALRLGQYHARYGAYPETIQAVGSTLSGGLPIDPFSGEGYRYRRESETFVLYSVGLDGADNAGTPGEEEGDFVWRYWEHKEPDADAGSGDALP